MEELFANFLRLKTENIRLVELSRDVQYPYPPPQRVRGATRARLEKVEEKFGLTLPPSYRSFLTITDGLSCEDEMLSFFPSTTALLGPAYRRYRQDYLKRDPRAQIERIGSITPPKRQTVE